MEKVRNVDSCYDLGCFGEYQSSHQLCSRYCLLRLRCAIAQQKNLRTELLEELMAAEELSVTVQ